MPDVPLDVAAARVALSPKPSKEERRPSTAALLAKIPFLQRSGSVSSDHSRETERDTSNTFPAFHSGAHEHELSTARRGSALAEVFDSQGVRNRRKSSLRKTVLQTTGRFRLDRKISKEQVPQIVTPPASPRASTTVVPSSHRQERDVASSATSTAKASAPTTSPTRSKPAIEKIRPETPVSIHSYPDSLIDSSQVSESPTTFSSTDGYASTIAPDDSASNAGISRFPSVVQSIEIPIAPASPTPASPATLRPPIELQKTPSPSPPSSESSFPPSTTAQNPLLQHRRVTKSTVTSPSPLISSATDALLAAVPPSTDPTSTWDYSETEWWGYIILIVTWLVFVVGMGSCFGVWSWAWDVGTTPYAPPEFEDDPTLPIVGYYPALMVLTAVMSWVWVVVAWVGMKYFKHAKIGSED